MSNLTDSPARPYGWRDFDQEVVEGLAENDARFINRRSDGWILSPLVGHYDTRLAWKDGNFKRGSVPVGDPPVSFRAAPTYVLEDPLDNVVAGQELIAEAIDGSRHHGEMARLGNETSEGALTWNVLRSLQEAGRLEVAAVALGAEGGSAGESPQLGFWGRRIERERAVPWPELAGGPSACLRLPGWGWVLIDPRFGGGTETLADAAATEAWLEQHATPGLFDDDVVARIRPKDLPHRMLERIAFAHGLKHESEQALVVALVRGSESPDLERQVGRCLADTADVAFRRVTWESLYAALDPDDAALASLRAYLENKSYGLRPAFALTDDDATEAG